MILNWDISPADFELLNKCVDRYMASEGTPRYKRRGIVMDLNACHSNGCSLDFQRLLDASPFDFMHDMIGIQDHINRETGKLENCFLPRLAARPAPVETKTAKAYEGRRDTEGDEYRIVVNGKVLTPARSLRIANHSPTGFSWGYVGSGPAQLALALLLDYFGDREKALNLYHDFMYEVVSRWPMDSGWTLTGEEIETVCARRLAARNA
jgi:hypothetical protein